MKCQGGHTDPRPEPAVGPHSWALAPCCYAWWERRSPAGSRDVAAVGGLASSDGSARQSPWACTAGPRARPLLPGTTKTPDTAAPRVGPGGAAAQWRPHRPGAGPGLQGRRLPTPDRLAGPQASKPSRERWPSALEEAGPPSPGAGSPRLTPGGGGGPIGREGAHAQGWGRGEACQMEGRLGSGRQPARATKWASQLTTWTWGPWIAGAPNTAGHAPHSRGRDSHWSTETLL